jgi:hypothetical protein
MRFYARAGARIVVMRSRTKWQWQAWSQEDELVKIRNHQAKTEMLLAFGHRWWRADKLAAAPDGILTKPRNGGGEGDFSLLQAGTSDQRADRGDCTVMRSEAVDVRG